MRHTFRRNGLWYAGKGLWTDLKEDALWFYGPEPTYHPLYETKGVGVYSETVERK